ncbi:MAG TPA: enoyl-CoA hydratase/isomerase family protein [Solirubrobacteraceae bacterium]|nr:enoyl-CoA hydratase/isomerase family protein [Solirubrobacteraceae bacterium]
MSPVPAGGHDVVAVYEELTEGLTRPLRLAELAYGAAERHPDLVPTRAQIDAERAHNQSDKAGLEIAQGDFIARVLADPRCGTHLIAAMSAPRPEALAALERFKRDGSIDLGPMRVDRDGPVGVVTNQNHACLNAEDDASARAMEIAIDLVLLDDAIEVGALRGGPATHPKHAGRRIFGAGINLTHLYTGQISLIEFMLERELGGMTKMYRGHGATSDLPVLLDGEAREKPWVAVVESFAIGGACQWLLVMDRVVAQHGAYFNLPARKEGIIPGCANLRLPRLVGERSARQAIMFERAFEADSAEGRLIADEVVADDELDAALERSATQLLSAGTTALVANRRALRAAQEPLDRFRRYMSVYASEQARCMYSPALIDNLERNWQRRSAGSARVTAGQRAGTMR